MDDHLSKPWYAKSAEELAECRLYVIAKKLLLMVFSGMIYFPGHYYSNKYIV